MISPAIQPKAVIARFPSDPARSPADPKSEPVFARFEAWTRAYVNAASPEAKAALESQGLALAKQRRNKLLDLIQAKPARALQLQAPPALRRILPPAMWPLLEEDVSGRGDLAVLAALPSPGREREVKPVFRTATFGEREYQAFVYGRRLGEPTRTNLPLHGVALDGLLALDENPVRILSAADLGTDMVAALPAACVVCGQSKSENPVGAGYGEVDGNLVYLCSPKHAGLYNQQWIDQESAVPTASAQGLALQSASSGTMGEKKLILIRVDFSDLAGTPFSDSTGTNLIANLNLFYREMSYGKAGFAPYGAGSTITPTYRMPQKAEYYGLNDYFVQLRKDARAAAAAAGYTLGNYNLDLICFGDVPGFGWAGLAYVGSAGLWLRNDFSTGVAGHELGHNFGLNHANFWDTAGASVIGEGTSVEYGDKFDTMGSAAAGFKHFNARYKNYLQWLPNSDVVTFSTNGTYQLYPHDLTNVTGPRALRVAKASGTNYWVEFRQIYTSNKWLMNGVGLRWAQSGNQSTLLLDTTAGSLDGKDDAAIVLGRTFSDFKAGVHITPLALAGTTPQSIRVMVNRGAFASNLPPTLVLSASATNAAANVPIRFEAAAGDPDGDPLAYSWDFGDRNFGTNTAILSHPWSASGYYRVRCVVSDMKGQTASDSVLVRIGSPSGWVVSGQVTLDGQPLGGARISASPTYGGETDSDGRYYLAGLPTGTYSLNAKLEGQIFIHPGFTNPVAVKSSVANLDFVAVPSTGLSTKSLIPAGSQWRYLDNGSNQRTGWSAPGFNDSAWKEGPALLGYGDNDVTTVIGYGPNPNSKYITYYFRHRFTVESLEPLLALTLGVLRDDGAVVYLNGREVFRSNLPAGTVAYTTLASSTVGGADEVAFYETEVSPTLLNQGTNVMAVEIHQASATSSDVGFDLRLSGLTASAPPNLAWQRTEAGLQLSWPVTALGWELYSAPSLSPAGDWSPVPNPVVIINGNHQVLLGPSNVQEFYLLRKP